MSIHNLRRDYRFGSLQREQLAESPIDQFLIWFAELQQGDWPDWFEINAMTLSTSTSGGHVSSRIVLLKRVDQAGFTFFTNYRSRKAAELASNAYAALCFFWPMFDRQVRIAGAVEKVDPVTSDEYFQARPIRSQLSALVSPQSQTIDDCASLEMNVAELELQYADKKVIRPDFWGGYRLTPEEVEFWQGKPSRLHDRFRYARSPAGWSIDRLAP